MEEVQCTNPVNNGVNYLSLNWFSRRRSENHQQYLLQYKLKPDLPLVAAFMIQDDHGENSSAPYESQNGRRANCLQNDLRDVSSYLKFALFKRISHDSLPFKALLKGLNI